MIVADTNLIVHLFLSGEHTKLAEQILIADNDWVAPVLWRSEFRNVLSLYIRQQLLNINNALDIIHKAEEFLLNNEYEVLSHSVLTLAKDSGCSAYDCEYVALAIDLKVPLITFDKKVQKNFPSVVVVPTQFIQ